MREVAKLSNVSRNKKSLFIHYLRYEDKAFIQHADASKYAAESHIV